MVFHGFSGLLKDLLMFGKSRTDDLATSELPFVEQKSKTVGV